MPFRDYDDLLQSIENWLARDDLTSEIADFVWLSELEIQREIKMRMRDEIATGTTVTGQQWIDMPADYSEGGFLRWTSDDSLPSIDVASYDFVDRRQKDPQGAFSGSTQRVGFLHGNRLYIGATPGTIDWELFYKGGVQHLSSEIRTNYLLKEYGDLLLYGSLLQSAPFLGADERIGTWQGFYEPKLASARNQEWRARTGHGGLVMKPNVRIY